MGVLTIQSCTQYRVMVYHHPTYKVYIPQEKKLFEWSEIKHTGIDSLSAFETIEGLRNNKKPLVTYITIK